MPTRAPRSLLIAIAACTLVLLGEARPLLAQQTNDPISTSAPVAAWSLVLEEVVQIPDSAGAAPRLEQLVANTTTGLAYVIDQRGTIYRFDPGVPSPVADVFLDLALAVGDLQSTNEAGVRSLAFHPDFDVPTAAGFRKMYLAFSRTAGSTPVGGPVIFDSPGATNHWTVISEWMLEPDGDVDPTSYRELMRIEQPFSNHNSGHLGFDPTANPGTPDYGKLFIAVGDGGSGGGPFDLSQDIDATPAPYPHGKVLRIDPLAVGAAPYTVPLDNPFSGIADRVLEVWAYGFRNPHKFEWDSLTGRMYVSDIGQGVVEEISVVRKGGNYGWNPREGAFVYVNGGNVSPLPVDHPNDDYLYPVAQYDHQGNGITGSAAIVGGPVYRGSQIPALSGTMFFADFATNPGPIFAVHVGQLVERDDLDDIESLSGGRLSPFEEVLIRDGGVDVTFREILRESTGLFGLQRTDTRWGVGPAGEIFVLNKQDGLVRRISGVIGHPGPPRVVPGPGLMGLFGLAGASIACGSRCAARATGSAQAGSVRSA